MLVSFAYRSTIIALQFKVHSGVLTLSIQLPRFSETLLLFGSKLYNTTLLLMLLKT
jgi:hypothetical protein